jgi:hypothetical protein
MTRMKSLTVFGIGLVIASFSAQAQHINLRMSVKIVVHPTTGARPAGVTPVLLTQAVARANQWMDGYWRGYRYELAEVVNIGGPSQGGVNGPSKWFNADCGSAANWPQFQRDTQTNGLYLFRANAINYYITLATNWNTGGAASFPWQTTNGWRSCWGIVNDGPFWIVHECGHFFGLPHTHGGCDCPGNLSNCTTLNGFSVGDDEIADTLPEGRGDFCFTSIDHITRANFNKWFTNCTPSEQVLAQNTFYNVMSYHDPTNKDVFIDRMTELQHDVLTTYANTDRANVASGFTLFVNPSTDCFFQNGLRTTCGQLGLGGPFEYVTNAVQAARAGGGDIILLRPGSYNERTTINKPVTLRATRSGWVTIGK